MATPQCHAHRPHPLVGNYQHPIMHMHAGGSTSILLPLYKIIWLMYCDGVVDACLHINLTGAGLETFIP